MSTSNTNPTDHVGIIVSIIFLIVGGVFTLTGFFWLRESVDKYPALIKTEATISYLEPYTYEDSDGDTVKSCHVYVDFTSTNGTEYNDVLIGGYSSSYKVGETIALYYNSDYPDEVYSNSDLITAPAVFLVSGLIFVFVAVFILAKTKRRQN